MVFGNMGDDSGTGVAFTRDPSTGVRAALRRIPAQRPGRGCGGRHSDSAQHLEDAGSLAGGLRQFQEIAEPLESTYKDVQDLEFTVERSKLYMLQTRNAKRTARAAVVTAVQMVSEGLIDKEEALKRVEPSQIQQLLVPQFDPAARAAASQKLGKGLAASPGAAVGKLVFDPDTAEDGPTTASR